MCSVPSILISIGNPFAPLNIAMVLNAIRMMGIVDRNQPRECVSVRSSDVNSDTPVENYVVTFAVF